MKYKKSLFFMFFLLGLIVGLLSMYFLLSWSIFEALEHSSGIIQNLNIDLNETQLVDSLMDYANRSGGFE